MTVVPSDAVRQSWTPRSPLEPGRMSHPSSESVRVFLAGADADARSRVTDVLSTLGHTVLGGADAGRDAVVRIGALRPDVVLLDVGLLAGPDAIEAEDIAEAAPGTAVVLFCAHADVRLTDREVGAPAVAASLSFPAPPGVLDSALRLAVRRGRSLTSARQEA